MQAINRRGLITRHEGTKHVQVFIWSDENAAAMEETILDQQRQAERFRKWRCLRIQTRPLLKLLAAVNRTRVMP